MTYDNENIFAKILRGNIPNDTVYEDEYVLAFKDINPLCPLHVLVIPKNPFTDASDFNSRATPDEITGFWKGLEATLELLEIRDGYRLIANTGRNGGQEVPHYHVHILGGCSVGPMVSRN